MATARRDHGADMKIIIFDPYWLCHFYTEKHLPCIFAVCERACSRFLLETSSLKN